MRAFENRTGFYTGDFGDDGHARLWFTPGPFTEREPVPILKRHSPNGIAWGYTGNGAADAARSILAHAADSEVAEVHYQAFKHEVIARLAVNEPFLLEVAPITGFLEARGIRAAISDEPFITRHEASHGMPASPSASRAGVSSHEQQLAEWEEQLRKREIQLDKRQAAMDAERGITPAHSAPAAPIRAQIVYLAEETGDSIATMAKGLDVEPAWVRDVLDGTITDVDLDHVQRLCEALHCNPFDLWGSEVGRSLLDAYPPELWPNETFALERDRSDTTIDPPSPGPEPPSGHEPPDLGMGIGL